MVQLNLALREINCKIVYFGCGLGGKTTNLEIVHEKADTNSRGELTSIATESDRTLFFDFMPLDLGEVSGMKVKFQLYTVPGQVYYNSTRKLVLRGADAVIFVADSQRSKMDENVESLENLEDCLKEQGRSLDEMPHVIQYNKRDLDDIHEIEELDRLLNKRGAPSLGAVAFKGDGVTETLKAAAGLLLEKVKSMSTESSSKPDEKARRDAAAIRTPSQPDRPVTDRERLQGGLGQRATTGSQPITTPAPRRVETPPAARSASAPALAEAPRGTALATPARVKPSIRPTTDRVPFQSGTRSMMISRSAKSKRKYGSKAALFTVIGAAVAACGAAAWFFLLK